MNKLIWSAIASVSIQLSLTNYLFFAYRSSNISRTITPKIIIVSWQEKFEQKRRETEFLDDGTEQLLNRHKKWLLLMSVIFVWMIYKSLWSSK